MCFNYHFIEERLNFILQREDVPEDVKSLIKEIIQENQICNNQQERFLEVKSHELRTPVTIIKGFIEFLVRNPDLSQEQIFHCYVRVSNAVKQSPQDCILDISIVKEKNTLT
ncbi:MAG: histidine kinase dimerization/phospho-acceptor domain-containing protein [Candidatus Hodarchaeales archaeon]